MKSVFKVGSRANIHLTSDKRVFGEIVSTTDEFVEVLEKRKDRPTPSIVYINYSNITCVYPEEEIAEVATAPETELKVESSPGGAEPGTPPPPGGGGPGIPPAPGGGGPGTPTAPGGGGPGTVPPPGGPVAPPPIHQS
jgi:hypothetical protein